MNIDEIYHFFCKATGCRILNGRKVLIKRAIIHVLMHTVVV